MTKNPKLIVRQPCKRVTCQHRLKTAGRTQVLKESRRASAFAFPRAAPRAVRTAEKRSGPAANFRAGIRESLRSDRTVLAADDLLLTRGLAHLIRF